MAAKQGGLQLIKSENTLDEFLKERIPIRNYDEKVLKPPYSLIKTESSKQVRKKKQNKHAVIKATSLEKKLWYNDFIPMHKLWLKYMETLLEIEKKPKLHHLPSDNPVYVTLTKADYHGCRMVVTKSKNPSLVGIKGIVVKETRNMMCMITAENRVLSIPKEHNVFTFRVGHMLFTMRGDHFVVKSTDRSSKKFKSRPTIDL